MPVGVADETHATSVCSRETFSLGPSNHFHGGMNVWEKINSSLSTSAGL